MNKNGFSRCGELYIGLLRKEGRFSTAHVYQNALFSFNKFCGNASVSFRQVTRDRLRRYGEHLYDSGLKPNTVSTYMRMLRSIYNRGVELGSAPYVHALFSFNKFCGNASVSFRKVTRDRLRRYGEHLYDSGLKPNTVSTYMRMLRSIYNRGVELGSAPYVHGLFRDVYTGVDIRQKRALPVSELRRLLYEDPKTDCLRRTQSIAALMFQFCGMSFADLAHLEKSALDCNVLRYNRIKTRTPMSVEVLDTAKEMMNQLRNSQSSRPGCPDYLFSILSGDKKRKDERAYREYQSALRRFNNHLKSLARALHLTSPVTSYTIRHSWATTAKFRGVPIEMISESLGHKSIKTTQIYLKGFELKERTEVNRKNLHYVKTCPLGRV